MCGISGFFNRNQTKISEHHLDLMLQQQIHRGPDYHGKYYDHFVGFAHNRLSLLDLSAAGNQPFEDENFVLVFNGEIYNFIDIKNRLQPTHYNSTSDTAVLFEALKQWGVEKTLAVLKGMFAFSWFDKKQKKLYLVRDRVGIKPLFYSLDKDNTVWFASEMKALLAVLDAKANPFKVLFSGLGNLERSRQDTAFDNIKHIEPGTYLCFTENNIVEKKYYSVYDTVSETEHLRLYKLSETSVLGEFNELFDASVKSMSISDAPMGSFVSGGIDSSII